MKLVVAGSLLAMMVSSAFAQNNFANGTIADIVANNTTLSRMTQALQRTGVDQLLSGETEITLFAPTDEAINAFMLASPGTWDGWLAEDPPTTLTEVLLYHATPGVITSEDFLDGAVLAMAAGGDTTLSASPPMIGKADIIEADIEASNGVRIGGTPSVFAVDHQLDSLPPPFAILAYPHD